MYYVPHGLPCDQHLQVCRLSSIIGKDFMLFGLTVLIDSERILILGGQLQQGSSHGSHHDQQFSSVQTLYSSWGLGDLKSSSGLHHFSRTDPDDSNLLSTGTGMGAAAVLERGDSADELCNARRIDTHNFLSKDAR